MAFGGAGVKYAIDTAGERGDHGEERGQAETESECGSSESEIKGSEGRGADAGGHQGGPPSPQELREAHVRQKTESDRLRTPRTARIARHPNPNKCDTRKRDVQFLRADKWAPEKF